MHSIKKLKMMMMQSVEEESNDGIGSIKKKHNDNNNNSKKQSFSFMTRSQVVDNKQSTVIMHYRRMAYEWLDG